MVCRLEQTILDTTQLAICASLVDLVYPDGMWTWLFFGLHELVWALADILLLLMVIAGFIRAAGVVKRMAGWLFVAYFVWVSYATALTAAIVWLNPGA